MKDFKCYGDSGLRLSGARRGGGFAFVLVAGDPSAFAGAGTEGSVEARTAAAVGVLLAVAAWTTTEGVST